MYLGLFNLRRNSGGKWGQLAEWEDVKFLTAFSYLDCAVSGRGELGTSSIESTLPSSIESNRVQANSGNSELSTIFFYESVAGEVYIF